MQATRLQSPIYDTVTIVFTLSLLYTYFRFVIYNKNKEVLVNQKLV